MPRNCWWNRRWVLEHLCALKLRVLMLMKLTLGISFINMQLFSVRPFLQLNSWFVHFLAEGLLSEKLLLQNVGQITNWPNQMVQYANTDTSKHELKFYFKSELWLMFNCASYTTTIHLHKNWSKKLIQTFSMSNILCSWNVGKIDISFLLSTKT